MSDSFGTGRSHPAFVDCLIPICLLWLLGALEESSWLGASIGICTLVLLVGSGLYWDDIGTQVVFADKVGGIVGVLWSIVFSGAHVSPVLLVAVV